MTGIFLTVAEDDLGLERATNAIGEKVGGVFDGVNVLLIGGVGA